jgi:hypothetical protein
LPSHPPSRSSPWMRPRGSCCGNSTRGCMCSVPAVGLPTGPTGTARVCLLGWPTFCLRWMRARDSLGCAGDHPDGFRELYAGTATPATYMVDGKHGFTRPGLPRIGLPIISYRFVLRPEPGPKTALSRLGNRLSKSSRRSLLMSVVPWRVVATTPDSLSTRKWWEREDLGRSTSNTPQGAGPSRSSCRTIPRRTSSLSA